MDTNFKQLAIYIQLFLKNASKEKDSVYWKIFTGHNFRAWICQKLVFEDICI